VGPRMTVTCLFFLCPGRPAPGARLTPAAAGMRLPETVAAAGAVASVTGAAMAAAAAASGEDLGGVTAATAASAMAAERQKRLGEADSGAAQMAVAVTKRWRWQRR